MGTRRKKACKLLQAKGEIWCGEGDLNPHEIAPASTSSNKTLFPRVSRSIIRRFYGVWRITEFRLFSPGWLQFGLQSRAAQAVARAMQRARIYCFRIARNSLRVENADVKRGAIYPIDANSTGLPVA